MRASKVALLIVGLLFVVSGLGLGAAAAVTGFGHVFQRDADGFVTTPTVELESDAHALTAEHLELVVGPDDWTPWTGDLDLRLRVTPAEGGGEVVAGIAAREDVERYLDDVARDEITNLGFPGTRYASRAGEATPSPPGAETFWVVSEEGMGTQTLTWSIESGQWAIVIMNADATPGLAVEADGGVQTGVLGPIALGLLLAALVLIAGGTALIIAAVPDRVPTPTAAAPAPAPTRSDPTARAHPVVLAGRLDPELSRWQWLVKWLLLIPHLVVLALLWGAFMVLTVVAWFAILITGRYPRGIFDFNVGVLRWTWRVVFYGYSALGTDRYPPFTLEPVDYPARLDIAYPGHLSRGLVLVKWLLALPHLLIVAVLTGGAATWTYQVTPGESWQLSLGSGLIGILVLVAGLALLITARYPPGLFDLVVGLNRWVYRVVAYVALMTDDYPPFRLDMGGDEPHVPPPPPPTTPGSTAAPDPRRTPA